MIKYLTILISMGLLISCAGNKKEVVASGTWYDFSKTDSLKNIYGHWQAIDDSLAFMSFKDSIATMGYTDENAHTDTFRTNYIFDAERGVNKLILVDKTLDTLEYGVMVDSIDTLYLIYLARGNSLIYKRIKP